MRARDNRGFTIPEALVAILLTGLLGAIFFSIVSVAAGVFASTDKLAEDAAEFRHAVYSGRKAELETENLRWYSGTSKAPVIYKRDAGWVFALEAQRK